MTLPAEKRTTLEALRTRIAERFRGTVPEMEGLAPRGPALTSGWPAVDRALVLRPGHAVTLQAEPGAGSLALVSAWARAASRQGEPVLVADATGSSLPHPWVEPPDGRAPIWVVVPPRPTEAWPAVDIALRSGAFGLVALFDPPTPPRGTGPRLLHLARTQQGRLVVSAPGISLPGCTRVRMHATGVRWREAPVGAAPTGRALEVAATSGPEPQPFVEVMRDDDVHTDRLRPSPRAADRRPSHGRGRHRYDA